MNTTYALHPSGNLIGSDGSIWRPSKHRLRRSSSSRYLYVRLLTGDKLLHHLILETFVGPRPAHHVGHHKDGDIHNNSISNLEWIEVHKHSRGSLHGRAILTEKRVHRIRALAQRGWGYRRIARYTGFNLHTIRSVLDGKSWSWLKSP